MNNKNTFKKIKWYQRLLYIVPAVILFACSFSFLMPKPKDISASAAMGAGGNVLGNDTYNYYSWTNGFQTIYVPHAGTQITSSNTLDKYSLMFPLPATLGANLMTSFPYNGNKGASFSTLGITTATMSFPTDLYSSSTRVDNTCKYTIYSTIKGSTSSSTNPPTFGELEHFDIEHSLYGVKSFAIVQSGMMIVDLELFLDSLCNHTTFSAGYAIDNGYLISSSNTHFVFSAEFMRFDTLGELEPWGTYTMSTGSFSSSARNVTFPQFTSFDYESSFWKMYFESNGRKIAFMRSASIYLVSNYINTSNEGKFSFTLRLYPGSIWSKTSAMQSFDYSSFAPIVEYTVNPIQWITEVTSTFFESELYPGFTFGGVFFTIAMICCAIAFLKLFAGG